MLCSRICKFIKTVLIWKILIIFLVLIYRRSTNITDDNLLTNYNLTNLPWWEEGECFNHVIRDDTNEGKGDLYNLKGTCGYRSSEYGSGQKILSYCLYGNYTQYARGLPFILDTTLRLYPGWIVRLYVEPQVYKNELCPLLSKYPHLHVCDVTSLPGESLGDIRNVEPRLWRLAALGDELVDVFLSRDIDSEVIYS